MRIGCLGVLAHGDTANAVEECYDAIAVLLRTIDVLEGRQELGVGTQRVRADFLVPEQTATEGGAK